MGKMEKDMRFGVIGSRRGHSFMRMCRLVGGGELTAVYDIDVPRGEKAVEGTGARVYGDLDAFLESGIDAVVVASPLPFHAEQAVAALERGLHVLSEVTA